jgi:hypothetical protein
LNINYKYERKSWNDKKEERKENRKDIGNRIGRGKERKEEE